MSLSAVSTTRESWGTWANIVTAIRLVAGMAIFAYAAVTRNETWNFIGLGVYWVLDVVDGALARLFDQETRLGAQFDILADRVLVAFFYLNYATLYPELMLPVAMFLFQFMGIDHYLSNQFMRWPIKSPNYFHLVDRTIWLWNWSSIGKLVNSAVVTGVLVLSKNVIAGTIVCGAILVVKFWTAYRMHQLAPPEVGWVPVTPDAGTDAELTPGQRAARS
ncbi:MAG: CDP-alcohol phosphatidyltransferase family protein [Deltaproteobacteria bacterium]|nr:CDP-alcohol phosphatidyltransferase family protein [Deltaproteobacteria bacterium]MDQ3301465.1 CDP-alcohol phosphatidyltransferase family protein [Myxococcota bacterium]